ncbi:hypothetical protein ABID19_000249 [Mesorhizobium robiniae]|uniref:Uncharacterized protein n=1 Tax=Mesorhizobium robiniae TaxID=559315 RepID=A0ABV2GG15_9HYPH
MPLRLSPTTNAGRLGKRQATEAIALIFSLLCDGSYARNLFMVLICATDPPAEAGFCFRRIGSGRTPSCPFAFVDGHQANA